jgi:hypothetical protein
MKKALVFSAAFIILFIYSLNTAKDASSIGITTKSGESYEYIVEKLDTLWDISESKLDDAFLWPKLWNVNPHIENPDLIYPGTRILIPSREELMKAPPKVAKKKVKKIKRKKKGPKSAFVFREKERQKYIVNRELFLSSGWISADFNGVGEVTYAPSNRQIAGKDDIVYLKMSQEEQGKKFFTVRDVKKVKHPKTGEILGHHLRITGILEIIGEDNNMPKAKILESFEQVQIGESLLPFKDIEPPLIPDSFRSPQITGYVIESHTNSQILGEGDVIFLDKGHEDGLQVSDVFSAIVDSPTERPIGAIQIISLQPTTSAAVVLTSTQEVLIGSRWGNK